MISIYTLKSYLTKDFRGQLFPLLLDVHITQHQDILKHYQLTDNISDCDVFIFPLDINNFIAKDKRDVLDDFIKLSQSNHKPLWVYSSGDIGYSLKEPNVITFRLGGFKSKLNEFTHILPSFVDDPLKHFSGKSWETIPKQQKPDIGFVGLANNSLLHSIRTYIVYVIFILRKSLIDRVIDFQPYYAAGHKRLKYLSHLSKSSKITSNFILRKKYRAGAKTKQQRLDTTQEFFNNIFDNTYTFCMRGGGNFSVRFYETLALGRIPVLINTDCKLPLEDLINWNTHCLIINENEAETIAEQLVTFHNSKSSKELEDLQRKNRELWELKLRRHTYFVHVYNKYSE